MSNDIIDDPVQFMNKFFNGGKIEVSEVKSILNILRSGNPGSFLDELSSQLDAVDDGTVVDFKEVQNASKATRDEALKIAFDFFDKNKDGVISDSEFRSALKSINPECPVEVYREAIGSRPVDAEGLRKLIVEGCGVMGLPPLL
ncbi:hypothetical protein M569_04805 [Genlisea aurea]|uniref:EF-hand domain-containing protein n=1 Tax=Genlisea aurea TaxID=192259 RepID=S8CY63_9LAMI|nr:hypothetical protein M569_04805 [Genlisea aurea]